jgi:secretion/DNA translocation related CpaE-like protein
VVLVGADQAPAIVAVAPDARRQTYVVTLGTPPDAAFPLALALGARQVVDVSVSAGWLVELLTDVTEDRPERAVVVGVIGATGGAGATTLACALGQWAQRSGDTAVIDCDPQGPGLDRVLGLELTAGFRWDALCTTAGRISARALREALPRRERLGVLSWYVDAAPQSLQAFAVREALSAARRGHHTVVLDLPRTPDLLVDELAARCDRLLVVTVASVLGVAGAARMRARFAEHPGVGLVLRGEALRAEEVSRAVRLPVLAQMREQRGIAESIDLGLGPLRSGRGPLARACQEVLEQTRLRPGGPGRLGGPVAAGAAS